MQERRPSFLSEGGVLCVREGSVGDAVGPFACGVLRGLDRALIPGGRDEPAYAVLLPARGGHDLGEGRALFAVDQFDDPRALAFCAGCLRFFGGGLRSGAECSVDEFHWDLRRFH